jgi:uncharacterized RDD family membrane protein YckC
MLCQRCSHPLPPLADRCLRCFALNPREPGPAFSIESDPPAPPSVQLAGDQQGGIEWQDAAPERPPPPPTERFAAPATARPVWTPLPQSDDPGGEPSTATPTASATSPSTPTATLASTLTSTAIPASAPASTSAPTSAPARPSPPAQLLAWSVDLALVLVCASLHLGVATALLGGVPGSAGQGLDLLLRGPRLPALWGALCALLAVAYSWLFTALGGRTPGLALAGLRVESQRGGTLTVGEALARAALAIPSAALGLSGFALALVDPRGQTLHDKLCRAVVVRSPRAR